VFSGKYFSGVYLMAISPDSGIVRKLVTDRVPIAAQ